MSKKRKRSKQKKGRKKKKSSRKAKKEFHLHPDTQKSIWAVVFVGLAAFFFLAQFQKAGPLGNIIFSAFDTLLGIGYVILPLSLLLGAGVFFVSEREKLVKVTVVGLGLMLLSMLGLIQIFSQGDGGWLGLVLGSLEAPFGKIAAATINGVILLIGVLMALNTSIRFSPFSRKGAPDEEDEDIVVTSAEEESADDEDEKEEEEPEEDESEEEQKTTQAPEPKQKEGDSPLSIFKPGKKDMGDYTPPPLKILNSKSTKPSTGDLRANANIIKRTLDSFGIQVEMGEINIGPKVTRYTLKPAEGIKLSRITALNQDLALALAAHPIRIEAPIPGKSLVGIEVPNKTAALVRLRQLMSYKEFQKAGDLAFCLGRDVTGEPMFVDIEKMPHLLIAGSTGSGKSVMIHSLIISLLYKNGPSNLRLALIDPKRVELSVYEGIPHLVSPVITKNKKAMGVFKWAISEMEQRYEKLQAAGNRDVKSYNKDHKDDPIPYLVIVVDELADLMASYGREIEGSIVRLAQMARATGIHLVLSTQRPSVEVITGLIKANITSRIALQVASQIDSRTILDTTGAQQLLGGGDLLFISSNLSKPKRVQGAFITEGEIKEVARFIRNNNKTSITTGEDIDMEEGDGNGGGLALSEGAFEDFAEEEEEDELFDDAVQAVVEAERASASLLQRRLRVGYARAARLLDMMEEKGLVSPHAGSKPRELYMERIKERYGE